MKTAIIIIILVLAIGCTTQERALVQSETPNIDDVLSETRTDDMQEEPFEDDTEEVPEEEAKSFEFHATLEPGIRISDGSVPYIHKTDNEYRLYYCGEGGILSAISADGFTFQKENGVRLSGSPGTIACDPTIVNLDEGMRMYYKVASGQGGPGQSIHKIYSATSSDGLNFKTEGVVIDSEKTDDRGWASVPEAILLLDGRVRIYYVSDSIESGHGIVSAISIDGLNFVKEDTKLTGFVDPAVAQLPDGTYLLLASVLPKPPKPGADSFQEGIYGFISEDGIDFSEAIPVYISRGAIDPSVINMEDKWRIYFWSHLDSPPRIHSIELKIEIN
jgi:hypothetical protein